jgi:predicted N-acetyltransferase YhbS
LLREGLKIAREMGYKTVFLWGNPDFYSKCGFVPSYKLNIFHKDFQEQKVEFIMVYQLCENALKGEKGIIDII